MDSTLEALEKVLTDLKKVGGVEASAAASRDGLLMKAIMPTGQHAETFAAMSATMLGAAETATTELGKGKDIKICTGRYGPQDHCRGTCKTYRVPAYRN